MERSSIKRGRRRGVDKCFTLVGLVLTLSFEIILVLQKSCKNSRVPPSSPSVNLTAQ